MAREDSWDTAQNRAAETGTAPDSGGDTSRRDYLSLAREAYQSAVDYREGNLAAQWERSLKAFNNQHPSGSKYFSEEYKYRSKLFRPKTRATVRKHEAAAVAAFFSTNDVAMVKAEDDDDPMQRASAAINQELLNYRLDKNPIPWFLTCIGAFQDTRVLGACVSYQYWAYEERVKQVAIPDPLTGAPLLDEGGQMMTEEQVEIISDEPRCELEPLENVLFDPGANWIDPVNTSPYVIRRRPMYVVDVEERVANDAGSARPGAWREVDRATILKAAETDTNATRQAREGDREDSKDAHNASNRAHDIVWVHETFMRIDGEDYVWWTLATSALLSDPVPVKEAYPHLTRGERPLVMGYSTIETHKVYPSSIVTLTEGLQQEANEIANQRIDNVRYAMNPRLLYKRNANVDLEAWNRSRPGGPVAINDPQEAIIDRPPDVTASAYAEQDRVNIDFDELAGAFSQGSVATNRNLNETVGGMNLLSQSADSVTDVDVMVFAETWVEPVLRQIVRMEQFYESDARIIALAGERAQLYQRFGIDEVTDQLLSEEVTTSVNVGIGATNPMRKLEKFRMGAETIVGLFGDSARMKLNFEEAVKEVFGTLGYETGERFVLPDDDPRVSHLTSALEQAQKQLEGKEMEIQARLREKQMQIEADMAESRMGHEVDLTKVTLQQEGENLRQARDQAHDVRTIIAQMRQALAEGTDQQGLEREKMAQSDRQAQMQAQARAQSSSSGQR